MTSYNITILDGSLFVKTILYFTLYLLFYWYGLFISKKDVLYIK